MILQTILDRPEASSWHRQLLPKAYFKSLSPEQVQSFLAAFASAIESRSKSKAHSDAHSDAQSEEPPAKFVKISTIKALAQLMQSADFISQRESVKILRSLFQKVTHIDVRCAILDVFLEILGDTSSQHEDIIEVLQDAILVAGSFDERTGPISDEQWLDLYQDGKLPEINADIYDSQTPVLEKLMDLGSDSQALMDRIVVPIIKLSIQNQRRWMEAFLQHIKAELPDITIEVFPPMTIQPHLLWSMIHHNRATLPATIDGISLLDCYSTYILNGMSSPPAVKSVARHILANHTLRNSNAGKYVLAVYNRAVTVQVQEICGLITSLPKDHRKPNGTTRSGLQTLILDAAELLLQHSEDTFEAWDVLIQNFAPPVTRTLSAREAWMTYIRPLLEQIVDLVNELRTTDLLAAPDRQPPVLPSMFLQHLWLLHHRGAIIPCDDILRVLVDIADHPACHIEFAILKAEVLRVEAGLKLGLALGIDGVCNAAEEEGRLHARVGMMAVDLVEALIRAAPKTEGSEGLRAMVGRWCRSEDEEVRMRGVGLRRFLGVKEEGEGREDGWSRDGGGWGTMRGMRVSGGRASMRGRGVRGPLRGIIRAMRGRAGSA